MRTQTISIYKFEELEDSAKEKARDWYRQGALDYDWWDCTFYDANEIAALMGIQIERIYFSGFSSQGDGACFEGYYAYKKGSVEDVKAYAPQDKELHDIALNLSKIQRKSFYRLSAHVKHTGHYYHSGCTSIDVQNDNTYSAYVSDDIEEAISEALRDYMNWIYRRLEAEHDYLMSEESVDESIITNEYEFHEDGAIA